MLLKLKHFWCNIRQLSGEDAYERYLAGFAEHQKLHAHKTEQPALSSKPLTRKDFFKQAQDSKWTGIKRCC